MKFNFFIVFLGIFSRTLAQDCPYGFSGENCKDECGLVENSSNLKIVGGKEAVPHSWPSIVFIDFYYKYEFKQPNGIVENKTEESTCGGSLIDRYTVLTAAHCFTKKFTVEDVFGKEHEVIVKPNKFHSTFESMYNVYIGMHDVGDLDGKLDGIKVPVYKFKIHWGYDSNTDANDIAIIKFKNPIELNKNIQLACLPNFNLGLYPKKFDIPAYAAGWGNLKYNGDSPDKLHNVQLTIYNYKYCKTVIPERKKNWLRQICAGELQGGKDTCQGDSGGPLYVKDNLNGKQKYVLVGVVSYGYGCARKNSPGIYTRVTGYSNWIKRHSGQPKF